MAELLRQCYSAVVPFSCIPARFTEPLTLESTGDYTLDKAQFPGLWDDEHARQPALIIAPNLDPNFHQSKFSPSDLPCEAGYQPVVDRLQTSTSHHQQTFHSRQHHVTEMARLPLSAVTGHSVNHRNTSSNNTNCGISTGADLSKAREDLFSILSGIQEKDFAMNTNPFDSMPALLSAVSYDCVPVSAHQADACRLRSRVSRQTHAKRRRLCHVMKVRQSTAAVHQQGCYGFEYSGNTENVPQMLQQGHSRKRSLQVDDLDDILLSDYAGLSKKRKTMPPLCHQELFSVSESLVPFGGGHGIVGY